MDVSHWKPTGWTTDGAIFARPGINIVENEYVPPNVALFGDLGGLFLSRKRTSVTISRAAAEKLLDTYRMKDQVRRDLKWIIEREMRDVLAWLRKAGHEL